MILTIWHYKLKIATQAQLTFLKIWPMLAFVQCQDMSYNAQAELSSLFKS